MLFTSPIFLFLFLPALVLVYYTCPRKLQNLLLLIASIVFYTWAEKQLVLLLLGATTIAFFCAIAIEKGYRKTGVFLCSLTTIGALIFYKYADFGLNIYYDSMAFLSGKTYDNRFLIQAALPLGISFYTFQLLSYILDVYHKKVKAATNFISFAMYVTFFPQLIAGPIVQYKSIAKALEERLFCWQKIWEGITRFSIGLLKKIAIANSCGFLADGIFNLPSQELSTPYAWLGALAYSMQLYYDFSGYSDMAIGLGKIFGFDFPENFKKPYTAISIQDFWRRWHITLSMWFKEYLYIALGGSKNGSYRTYRNILVVFLVTGLWHGASFTYILWGLIHGICIIIERMFLQKWLQEKPKILSHVYVGFVLLLSWPIFRLEDFSKAMAYLQTMLLYKSNTIVGFLDFYATKQAVFMLFIAIALTMLPHGILSCKSQKGTLQKIMITLIALLGILYSTINTYNPFIYFRF